MNTKLTCIRPSASRAAYRLPWSEIGTLQKSPLSTSLHTHLIPSGSVVRRLCAYITTAGATEQQECDTQKKQNTQALSHSSYNPFTFLSHSSHIPLTFLTFLTFRHLPYMAGASAGHSLRSSPILTSTELAASCWPPIHTSPLTRPWEDGAYTHSNVPAGRARAGVRKTQKQSTGRFAGRMIQAYDPWDMMHTSMLIGCMGAAGWELCYAHGGSLLKDVYSLGDGDGECRTHTWWPLVNVAHRSLSLVTQRSSQSAHRHTRTVPSAAPVATAPLVSARLCTAASCRKVMLGAE